MTTLDLTDPVFTLTRSSDMATDKISQLQNSLIASNCVIAVLCQRAGGRLEITDDEFKALRKDKAPKAHNAPKTGNLVILVR